MRWDDERYVRIYTRDTSDWVAMSWEARAVFVFLLRAADRAGIVPMGKKGLRGLAALLHVPADVLEPAIMELGEDGCISCDAARIIIPNFMDAQEIPISDAQRKREQRERDRAKALSSSGEKPSPVTNVTNVTPPVTAGHDVTQPVTPNRAFPSRAEPCLTKPSEPEKLAGVLPNAPRQGSLVEVPKEKASDPRHAPLSKALEAEFTTARGAKYGHQGGKDAKAITRLLALAGDLGPSEVCSRWKRGLQASNASRCDTFHDLAERWNRLTAAPRSPQDVRKGVVRADSQDWAPGAGFDGLSGPGGHP